jgi:hypothetical protein
VKRIYQYGSGLIEKVYHTSIGIIDMHNTGDYSTAFSAGVMSCIYYRGLGVYHAPDAPLEINVFMCVR